MASRVNHENDANTQLIVYYIGLAVYRLYFHPLAKFPGPPLHAISAMPFNIQSYLQGIFTWKARGLHAKYGKIVRIGPNRLAVEGSIGWTDVYGHRPGGTETEFAKLQGFFGPVPDHGIIAAPNREEHRRHRRALAHAFSDTAMHEQEPLITYYVDLLIRRISEETRAGVPSDMLKWFNYVSFDIIGDLSLAESFNALQTAEGHPWITNMFKGIKGGNYNRFLRLTFPMLLPIAVLFDPTGAIKAFWENRLYSETKCKARLAKGADEDQTDMIGSDGKPVVRRDFIGYMMRENKDKEKLTEQEIIRNSNILISAGSETTATCMGALSYLFTLPENRQWRDAAINEVRTHFKKEADIQLNTVGANVLPILHACIEEALRIHPPASETPPRVSPGACVGGEYVPKGVSSSPFQAGPGLLAPEKKEIYTKPMSNTVPFRQSYKSSSSPRTTTPTTLSRQINTGHRDSCPQAILCTSPGSPRITWPLSSPSATGRAIASAKTWPIPKCALSCPGSFSALTLRACCQKVRIG